MLAISNMTVTQSSVIDTIGTGIKSALDAIKSRINLIVQPIFNFFTQIPTLIAANPIRATGIGLLALVAIAGVTTVIVLVVRHFRKVEADKKAAIEAQRLAEEAARKKAEEEKLKQKQILEKTVEKSEIALKTAKKTGEDKTTAAKRAKEYAAELKKTLDKTTADYNIAHNNKNAASTGLVEAAKTSTLNNTGEFTDADKQTILSFGAKINNYAKEMNTLQQEERRLAAEYKKAEEASKNADSDEKAANDAITKEETDLATSQANLADFLKG